MHEIQSQFSYGILFFLDMKAGEEEEEEEEEDDASQT